MRYLDFTVRLGQGDGGRFRARVDCSRAGEGSGWFSPPFSPEQLRAFFSQVIWRGWPRHLRPPTFRGFHNWTAKEIGEALFESLFSGQVCSVLDRSLGSLQQEKDLGLRIRLKLDLSDQEQGRLHALPWELLYKPSTADFLGLSRFSSIVRYLEVERPERVLPLPGTLRILAIVPKLADTDHLDLPLELRNLTTLAHESRKIEVECLPCADMSSLRSALLNSEFHVLHFMGHGGFDTRTGRGFLLLDGSGNKSEQIPAEAIATTLKDFHSLRLAVLNVCEGARAGCGEDINSFAGVAPALVRAGLPAVLAMQFQISDRAAITFSEAFYRRLCAGDPVDAAVTEGRMAIHADQRDSYEWAIPALFMRVSDGSIFGATDDTISNRRKRADTSSQQKIQLGLDQLRVGNYDLAIRELLEALTLEPRNGSASIMLGIALARGSKLRGIAYSTAQEMNRLFAAGLLDSGTRNLAATALTLLKLDYFQNNSVRDLQPALPDVLAIASRSILKSHEVELLRDLSTTEGARRKARQLLNLDI